MRRGSLADYANIDGLFGVLISRRFATLHELGTVYSYRDALIMGEIVTVNNYNEWVGLEDAKNGNHR